MQRSTFTNLVRRGRPALDNITESSLRKHCAHPSVSPIDCCPEAILICFLLLSHMPAHGHMVAAYP